jgi:hypothetical protein
MFLKITTCCAFAGTDSTHIIEVDDNLSGDEIRAIVDEYIQSDIEPDGDYEIIEEEDIENELDNTGCELEKR